jgi:hypothetical protein
MLAYGLVAVNVSELLHSDDGKVAGGRLKLHFSFMLPWPWCTPLSQSIATHSYTHCLIQDL